MLLAIAPGPVSANPSPLPFDELAARCAPDIHPTTLKGVVSTESSWNPYAIGVVGGSLQRQPRSLDEAVAAARDLESKGFNFSMGLGQVNRYNLAKYSHTYETIFEPCGNLKAGAAILKDCYLRARERIPDDQQALRAAFSCYYSGNFTRGFRPDSTGQPSYVQKVVANAIDLAQSSPVVPAVQPQASDSAIPVRSAARPSSPRTARTRPSDPSPWVVYADAPAQRVDTPQQAASPDTAPVKVQLLTPTSPAPASAARNALAPTPTPARAVQPTNAQQDAPFVQFVN
ncbi:lytic transglycosylase domain-containing protein [Variovorax sp. YR216]|uniref:lytic transglycosylase domain-containing protein n=1 Tax=Variovorax sp. YR216 TaxID=1882828 RepID=UPI00089C83D3|nr:lytic transglycosylase domain-containing protein [Variovorax sp. YR216]SEB26317.1 type IV secretion system protein VirB1 [Variovorax sp. YR216]